MNHSSNVSLCPALSNVHDERAERATAIGAKKGPADLRLALDNVTTQGGYSVRHQGRFAALAGVLSLAFVLASCTAPPIAEPTGPTGEPVTQADCNRAKAWEAWLIKEQKSLPSFCLNASMENPDQTPASQSPTSVAPAKGKAALTGDNSWCEISAQRADFQKAYMTWRKNRLSSNPSPKGRAVRPKFGKGGKLTNLAELQKASISSILRGLGKSTRGHLKTVTEAALASESCSSALFLALGSAWENFLPKADFPLIGKLYERSADCGASEAEDATNTRFRGGLFFYASGDYAHARDLFAKSAAAPSSTRARSLFWLHRSHLKLGDKSAADSAIDKLESLHPTSFHGILGMALANRSNSLRSISRWYSPRSESASMNTLVQATEALQSCGAIAGSVVLSNWSIGQMPTPADPKNMLYIAKLRQNANEHPVKIAITADALAREPSLISQETLELFYPRPFWDAFDAQKKVLDPYFLLALARQESAFDPGAVSSAKAMGLLQLIPQTARRFRAKGSLRNPLHNVEVGARYMNFLIKASDGRVYHSLASYNAGPGKVKLWMKRYQTEDPMLFVDLIPYRETREYVSSVLRNYFWYRTLYGKDTEMAPVVAGAFPADAVAVTALRNATVPMSESERAAQIARAEKDAATKEAPKETPNAVVAKDAKDAKSAPVPELGPGKDKDAGQSDAVADSGEKAQDSSKSGIRINKDQALPYLAVDSQKTADVDEEKPAAASMAPGTAGSEDDSNVLPAEISVAPEIDKSPPN